MTFSAPASHIQQILRDTPYRTCDTPSLGKDLLNVRAVAEFEVARTGRRRRARPHTDVREPDPRVPREG